MKSIMSPETREEELEDRIEELEDALRDAKTRLRGAGMLGGNDDPVCAALNTQRMEG